MLAYKKKHTTTTQETKSHLKNGVLKVFFLTQGITGEPNFSDKTRKETASYSKHYRIRIMISNRFDKIFRNSNVYHDTMLTAYRQHFISI